jgi:hypothetical protein
MKRYSSFVSLFILLIVTTVLGGLYRGLPFGGNLKRMIPPCNRSFRLAQQNPTRNRGIPADSNITNSIAKYL